MLSCFKYVYINPYLDSSSNLPPPAPSPPALLPSPLPRHHRAGALGDMQPRELLACHQGEGRIYRDRDRDTCQRRGESASGAQRGRRRGSCLAAPVFSFKKTEKQKNPQNLSLLQHLEVSDHLVAEKITYYWVFSLVKLLRSEQAF